MFFWKSWVANIFSISRNFLYKFKQKHESKKKIKSCAKFLLNQLSSKIFLKLKAMMSWVRSIVSLLQPHTTFFHFFEIMKTDKATRHCCRVWNLPMSFNELFLNIQYDKTINIIFFIFQNTNDFAERDIKNQKKRKPVNVSLCLS